MINFFINIQYCYDYLINQIPVTLLLYSHIPTALVALFLGVYVLFKVRNLSSVSFFIVGLMFALWCLFDLASWFSFLGSANTMFMWSLLDLIALVMFGFSYYFLYTFTTGKDLSFWQKIFGLVIILPTAIWTFRGSNLTAYDSAICEAVENSSVTSYLFVAQGIIVVLSVWFIFYNYFKNKNRLARKKLMLVGSGMGLFMIFFLSSTYLVSLLAESDSVTYAYNYEHYGLFGMPLLLGFLVFVIVRYHAFDIKLIGAQSLVGALVVLIASQFLFIEGNATKILTAVTLVVTGIIGINLIRSVKKEVQQRERIEKQEKALEVTNSKLASANSRLQELDKQKSEFLSFASHQLRSPLTAIKGHASLILDGDYGQLPAELKYPVQIIFDSTSTLVNVVNDYLNVSRIELGQMKYDFAKQDMKQITQHIVEELRPNIDKAGLVIKFTAAPGDYTALADKDKIIQVITNIIDNSVKYTKKGSISVELKKTGDKMLIAVKDTGIGISKENLSKLFAKFVRASNANQTNSRGTGLGLYIAKDIIAQHKGKIWVESEGEGKGSQFYIEIPVVKG